MKCTLVIWNDESKTRTFASCKNMRIFCACMLIIGFLRWYSWQTQKRHWERVELMASYTTKHVSYTTVTWDGCARRKSTNWDECSVNEIRERERESETAAEKTIAKKRLNIFSPLSLNVVFQYLFIFFKLGCLCMCVYIEMYACGLCAMTVDDFCIACTEFRSFRCELVSEYNAVAVRTLNGHNHHLWCMGTKSCFYCDGFGGRMENCT